MNILDVFMFFVCGLLKTKSSPNLLHTNVVSMAEKLKICSHHYIEN